MTQSEILGLGAGFLGAVIIAGFLRSRGTSPALPLMVVGLVIGFLPVGPQVPTNPEFVLVVILAPLVFGEALSSSIVDLRRVSRPVLALAVGLVIFGAYMVGLAVSIVLPGIPISMAFALGAILAPTDAVAVAATAKQARLPRRLVMLLEGESLVNDGTALTLLRVASAAAFAGSVTAGQTTLILLQSVLGGVLVGVLAGSMLVNVMRNLRDHTVVNSFIIVAPFPIYIFAEQVEGSGILAVVIAALLVGHSSSSVVAYTGRLQAQSLWRTFTFLLQAAAFFLVGLEFPEVVRDLQDHSIATLAVVVVVVMAALLFSRATFVLLMWWAATPDRRRLWGNWVLLAWAGSRGPISALAAFTLPLTDSDGDPLPYRSLVITVAISVVVVSLFISPTIAPLARRLKLPEDDDSEMLRWAQMSMARAALRRLEEIQGVAHRSGRPIPPDVVSRLGAGPRTRLEQLTSGTLPQEQNASGASFLQDVTTEMIHAEQQELLRLRDEEALPDAVMRHLQSVLDVRLSAVRLDP